MGELYPGQAFYHRNNEPVRRAEENWAKRQEEKEKDFFLQVSLWRKEAEEAGWERDRLIGNANSWNQAFYYYRAGGDCICKLCGLDYYSHPVTHGPERWHYGCELHVLCNTDRVKL